ncbi:hypothetical protein, partial [Effusibacillus consociatus]
KIGRLILHIMDYRVLLHLFLQFKKQKFCVLWLTFCLLTGCQSGNVERFKGESEHWSGDFRLDMATKDIGKETFTLKYKKTDVKSVKNIKYSLEGPHIASGGTEKNLPENGKIVSYIGGSEHPLGNAVLKVKVEWNGQTEEFDMVKQ